MIPYLEWHIIQLGPIPLQVWGIFVAAGFLLGTFMSVWLAKERKLDHNIILDLVPWLVIAALLGGRLGHVFFYDPGYYVQHPLEVFALWQGGSSLFGGLFLCLIIGLWFLARRGADLWEYADVMAFGLPFGLWIGRIGCFLIHDHPGTPTNSLLGVKYPDGVIRHDLGLELSVNGFVLSMLFLLMSRKHLPVGTYLSVFSIWYGIVRFILDFYRTTDATYLGLTPAQYFCILFVAFGVFAAYRTYRKMSEKAA